MTIIHLSPAEIQMAAFVGIQRTVQCLQNGSKHRHGAKGSDGWQMTIEGALGECAVAKCLGIYWSKGQEGAPDVGSHDVRTTHHPHGKLLIHPDDHDDRRYYLATGLNGTYKIHGWMMGKDAKNQKYWSDPQKTNRWAYFVPQNELQPL